MVVALENPDFKAAGWSGACKSDLGGQVRERGRILRIDIGGSFTASSSPIASGGIFENYEYVNSKPLTMTDPAGCVPWLAIIKWGWQALGAYQSAEGVYDWFNSKDAPRLEIKENDIEDVYVGTSGIGDGSTPNLESDVGDVLEKTNPSLYGFNAKKNIYMRYILDYFSLRTTNGTDLGSASGASSQVSYEDMENAEFMVPSGADTFLLNVICEVTGTFNTDWIIKWRNKMYETSTWGRELEIEAKYNVSRDIYRRMWIKRKGPNGKIIEEEATPFLLDSVKFAGRGWTHVITFCCCTK